MDFWTTSYSKDPSLRERSRHNFIFPFPEIPNKKSRNNFPGLLYFISFQVRSFIQQILEGLGHIHSMNVLHLDIKVSPLLLSASPTFPVRVFPHGTICLYSSRSARQHPDGVSAERRDQDLRLWLLPGSGHVAAPVQPVGDAGVRGPRGRSHGARLCGH